MRATNICWKLRPLLARNRLIGLPSLPMWTGTSKDSNMPAEGGREREQKVQCQHSESRENPKQSNVNLIKPTIQKNMQAYLRAISWFTFRLIEIFGSKHACLSTSRKWQLTCKAWRHAWLLVPLIHFQQKIWNTCHCLPLVWACGPSS